MTPTDTTSPEDAQADGDAAATAAAVVPTNAQLRVEYARLIADNRRMDAQKRENAQRMRDIKQRVLDGFAEDQMRAADIVGVGNLHLKKTGTAKIIRDDGDYTRDPTPAERERARDALQRAGLGDLVRANFAVNSVSAALREMADAKEPFPEAIADGFFWDEGFDIALTT